MCLAAIYWARLDRVYFASTRQDAAGIGFDDDFIYQQIPLDLAARSLPMAQLPTAAAADLFSEWSAKTDKIPY
jgi:guanine deaminase